ncbi:MAG: sortase [Candidatus Dormibacteraeota bacterium]|nr:sortase [Candidatus Dormibacteraeota bacterium]
MVHLLQRWRTPLLTGIGLWILSFPLLTSHPAVATRPVAAAQVSTRTESGHLGLARKLAVAVRPVPAVEAVSGAATTAYEAAIATQVATAPVVAAAPAAPAAVAPPRPVRSAVGANWIVVPRLGVSLSVGWYGDCLGRAVVPHYGAWRWSCAGANNTYIMAHNPGTFTPILGIRAGDLVQYGDPSGRVHSYQVTSTTIVSNTQMWPLGATAVSSLTLQTCWTWDGSRDFIVRAVEI